MSGTDGGRGLVLTLLIVAATAGLTAVVAQDTPEGAADAWSAGAIRERFPDPDRGAKDDDFVSSLDCQECHEDRWKSLGTSFHAGIRAEKKGVSRGCESCHGPGRVHYDEAGEGPIRNPAKADAAEMLGVCLRCHADVLVKPVDGHREWIGRGKGKTSLLRCNHCHPVHVDKSRPGYDEKIGPFAGVKALEKAAEYIPASACIECHPDFHPEMARSGHRKYLTEGNTCGTCHGPGSLHQESGGDRRKIINPEKRKPADVIASCNHCHMKGESVQRWTCAEHAREKVSCIVCHDTNAARGRTLRKPEFELCGSCHLDVRAKFLLPNRHRVREGRMLCSDCHDPHGNTSRVRDRDLRLRTCAKCHREKTGPFLYDHGIKRADGCVACHEPHGSTNRRMLTHRRTRQLCLQCHPETTHDLRDAKYRKCISCHVEIHGSDIDRIFRR